LVLYWIQQNLRKSECWLVESVRFGRECPAQRALSSETDTLDEPVLRLVKILLDPI